jgi:SAM-dependent methyltransferase
VVAQVPGSGFVDPSIAECVMWFEGSTVATVMAQLGADTFIGWSEQAVARFASVTPVDDIAAVADLIGRVAASRPTPQRRVVRRVHIGSGREYKPGWFNVDIVEATRPDAVLDLSQPLTWPMDVDSPTTGPVTLEAGQVELIYANNVLEHVGDLPRLMSNCLDLLALEGELVVVVPCEHSDSAWQDPTHVRAMNERSWLYYTAWFWYLGWIEHRFDLKCFDYLDDDHNVVTKEAASQMRVELVKVTTSAAERMLARSMRADFGLPELVA